MAYYAQRIFLFAEPIDKTRGHFRYAVPPGTLEAFELDPLMLFVGAHKHVFEPLTCNTWLQAKLDIVLVLTGSTTTTSRQTMIIMDRSLLPEHRLLIQADAIT